MVDPKKDYELLMRYLQGGAVKREPPAREQPYAEGWQQVSPPSSTTPDLEPSATHAPATKAVLKNNPSAFFPWTRKPLSLRKWARLTVAILSGVLLSALLWNAFYFYRLSAESMFAELYEPFATAPPANASQTVKGDIEAYYAAGNFVAATLQSRKQPQLTDREKLLTGLAYLHRDDLTKAIRWLEPLSNNFKSPYRRQAEYYLALLYLKNEDYDRAVVTMERIAHTHGHPYQDKFSDAVISDIKMLKWK